MSDYSHKYTRGKQLGSGSFGSVWAAEHKHANIPVAIKLVKKAKLSDNTYIKLMQDELKVLQEADHVNIPKVFEIFEDDKHYVIVSELISGGDMLAQMHQKKVIQEKWAAKVIK